MKIGTWLALAGQVRELQARVDLLEKRATLRPLTDRPHITIGHGCTIDPGITLYAREDAQISIGDNVSLNRGAELNGPVTIGNRTYINRDLYARQGTIIGSDCSIGPFVRIITDSHEIGTGSKRAGRNTTQPVKVGNGVWIGAGATILPGVMVGDGVVIAAGAVVVVDVPPHTLVGGVPAVVLRKLD